jgi:hypothetical protein
MRSPVRKGILGCLLLPIWCATAAADGGFMCLSGTQGNYHISVFTAPKPFRAGPVDVSVLVQDASSGNPLTQVQVRLRMIKSGRPALEYPATSEMATNKLLLAAQFVLPEPGPWHLEVEVRGPQGLAVLAGEVQAAEPLARWEEFWPWFSWPAIVVAIFCIHHVFARSPSGKSTNRLGSGEPGRSRTALSKKSTRQFGLRRAMW